MTIKNRRFLLASRPAGEPTLDNWRLEEQEIDPAQLSDGQILVKTLWISVDPYMRGRMREQKSYTEPAKIGDVFGGEDVGQVIESKDPNFAKGDYVRGFWGWQEYGVLIAQQHRVFKLNPEDAPVSTALGVLGMPGMTAYFGLLDVCSPKKGETVVVSGAAGAVGSYVGQIAKLKGCRVVGIAGGQEKCDLLTKEFGFDAAIDYKTANNDVKVLTERIQQACPSGVDVYFDNVGGVITDAVFNNINVHARISVCGSISQYNVEKPELGPRREPLFIAKRCRMEGFLVSDFLPKWPQALQEMLQWVREGKVKYRETVTEGFENTPQAFLNLFKGANIGKQLVKVSDPIQ